jgi:hypothetical protein
MRLAFRIVAGILGVATIGLSLPFAIGSLFSETDAIHRFHFFSGSLGYGVFLGVSLLACALRPDLIGPFWVAVAAGVASTVAGIVSSDFISGVWFPAPIAIVVLFLLHPARKAVLGITGVDVPATVLALVALVPASAYALTQSALQRNGIPANPHVDFHHYSGMAAYALTVPLAAFAGALRVPGRRVGVWIVGVGTAGLAVSSLLLSDYESAFDPLWGWLALAWAAAYVGVAEVVARRPQRLAVA